MTSAVVAPVYDVSGSRIGIWRQRSPPIYDVSGSRAGI